MKKKKAFTLVEIIIVVAISSVILAILYQIMSATLGSMFKSSTKMTNLRAASIILERIKNDVRCSVIPINDGEQQVMTETEFSFVTTSDQGHRRKVTYKYSPDKGSLTRQFDSTDLGARILNQAKVASFSVVSTDDKYITVTIVVDNEKDKENRTVSSKANKIELKAILYPRFFTGSLTDEERFWHKTQIETQEDDI